jgi:hypothetical protein
MATRQWAVNADGTFDFNNPANWVFATVPGAVDVAQFNTNATDTVTGDATVAELLVTQGTIDLAGSYTMSGAQATDSRSQVRPSRSMPAPRSQAPATSRLTTASSSSTALLPAAAPR